MLQEHTQSQLAALWLANPRNKKQCNQLCQTTITAFRCNNDVHMETNKIPLHVCRPESKKIFRRTMVYNL